MRFFHPLSPIRSFVAQSSPADAQRSVAGLVVLKYPDLSHIVWEGFEEVDLRIPYKAGEPGCPASSRIDISRILSYECTAARRLDISHGLSLPCRVSRLPGSGAVRSVAAASASRWA